MTMRRHYTLVACAQLLLLASAVQKSSGRTVTATSGQWETHDTAAAIPLHKMHEDADADAKDVAAVDQEQPHLHSVGHGVAEMLRCFRDSLSDLIQHVQSPLVRM